MSWKTVVVKDTECIFLKNNQLAFKKEGKTQFVPLHDLDCVVLDNNYTYITSQLLSKLAENNVFLLVCNQKHDPNGVFLPFNTHWKPLSVFRLQTSAKVPFKKRLWTNLIRSKIDNSAIILEKLKYLPQKVKRLQLLSSRLISNDDTNCEAQAAKIFFYCLYGSEFIRHGDDGINAALDYGNKILLSAVTRSLVKYGFFTQIGIWHQGEENAFNLACDLMEPFRPVVDYFIKLMEESIGDTLIYNQRLELIKLLNYRVSINNEFRTVSDAINLMCRSLLTAFKNNNSSKLLLPRIIIDENKYCEQLGG